MAWLSLTVCESKQVLVLKPYVHKGVILAADFNAQIKDVGVQYVLFFFISFWL